MVAATAMQSAWTTCVAWVWLGSHSTVYKTGCGLELVQGLWFTTSPPNHPGLKDFLFNSDKSSSLLICFLCCLQCPPVTLLNDIRSGKIMAGGFIDFLHLKMRRQPRYFLVLGLASDTCP